MFKQNPKMWGHFRPLSLNLDFTLLKKKAFTLPTSLSLVHCSLQVLAVHWQGLGSRLSSPKGLKNIGCVTCFLLGILAYQEQPLFSSCYELMFRFCWQLNLFHHLTPPESQGIEAPYKNFPTIHFSLWLCSWNLISICIHIMYTSSWW